MTLRTFFPTRELALATVVTAVVGSLLALGWTQPVERPVADLLKRLVHSRSPASSPVAAVVIDDRVIEEIGPAPWSRKRIATLVDLISEEHPRAIVIDILLSEPRDEEGDSMLERSLRRIDPILAAVLSPDGGWLLPLERFGGAESASHAHAEADTDGVVRSIAYTKQSEGLALPALSISAAMRGGWQGPIMPGRRFLPDFREAPEEILRISAADLLEGVVVDKHFLEDRVAFLGYSAAGTTDQHFVPVGDRNRPTAGVLVHAAIASSLLRDGLLEPCSLWLVLVLTFTVALVAQVIRSLNGRLRIAYISALPVLVVVVAVVALWAGRILLPTVGLILAVLLSAGLREAIESRQAQTETGAILASLLAEEDLEENVMVPRGVHGRLAMVRNLHDRIAQDRNLRRTLLEGMNEGVVLWDESGHPALSNRVLTDLWEHQPTLQEVQRARAETGIGDEALAEGEVRRGPRTLEIEVLEVAGGHLGLVRDATERFELDRRRREMHRLVSHELKTPLASISGFGEMLQTYEMSPDELDNVAGMIRSEADRLGEMVRTFLDIERLGSDRWEREKTEIDVAALVENRIGALAPAAEAQGKIFNLQIDPASRIRGVEQLISQLVENLVGNAIKYSPDGGEIRVELGQSSDGGVCFRVSDRGTGVPPEAIPHLFERFYRVPGATAEGSGLGLALVKEVADRHGATIHVESEQGKGSCFTVLFPGIGAFE